MKNVWRTLLYRLSGNLKLRIISDGTRPYLERHYLGTVFGLRLYLHRFVGDDPDRGLHDHPWPWAFSLVLAGWYNELRRTNPLPQPVRWFNTLRADTFHRVLLPEQVPGSVPPFPMPRAPGQTPRYGQLRGYPKQSCYTLFIHPAKTCKPWGFWHETPAGTFSMPNPSSDARNEMHRPATAQWKQFTYDHGGMGSDNWWNEAPIAKLHLQRQPQD
jgi:hypothetical protein